MDGTSCDEEGTRICVDGMYNILQYIAVQYHVHCSTVFWSTLQLNILEDIAVKYFPKQRSKIFCSTLQCDILKYFAAQYFAVYIAVQ